MNMQQLLVVLPYHQKDLDLATKLLDWIGEISPKLAPHCCLLAADAGIDGETKINLGNKAKAIFGYAETAIVPAAPGGWPASANSMFAIASAHVKECFKLPFLWLEPDCTPMRPSWLDEMALEYSRCPKLFMGAMIQSNQAPLPPVHLAGCAVYPANAFDLLKDYTNPMPSAPAMAWDMASAVYMQPRAVNTLLIHHHYGTFELPPTFKEEKLQGDPVNTCTLDFVRKEAAIFHRCKNGTLIDLLRQKRNSKTKPTSETAITPAPVKRSAGRPRKESVPA